MGNNDKKNRSQEGCAVIVYRKKQQQEQQLFLTFICVTYGVDDAYEDGAFYNAAD